MYNVLMILQRLDMVHLLKALDKRLSSPERIILCGGGALNLAYGSNRTTIDIDVIAPVPLSAQIKKAALEVARELGAPEDWFNDECKGFADYLPHDWEQRLVLLPLDLKRIEVFSLGKADLLTLKLVAGRERDLQDIEHLGIFQEDVGIILSSLDKIGRFDAKSALKIRLYLEELGYDV
ncbi:MAG: hypothetical protein COV43_07775 [Deltaproteobacteria bacterium CG11_big_fil_rev_8_21_14_0_20_42_23]|nr:MAG: hypothetical protein COV43_07775 [Deltaproteobacteria bacterium CG11_big_fil_rev_8_21_14_0_20_42_23]PJC63450.1 MAG: hypothetical protein CO021_09395 [Deltaproteobacteria bacterium CG_4_9_14_0_2_um_filter_42_21]